MDYYKILIVGASGRGKTYSFRNMDKANTAFINVEHKPLPFPGQFKINEKPKNTKEVFDLLVLAKNTKGSINCVIIDSFSAFLDFNMKESKANFKGWDVMNNYNSNIAKFNELVKEIDKEVFVTAHYEYVGDELTGQKEKRVKSKGKEWEGSIEKDYTVCIYTDAKVLDPMQPPQHYFRLVTDGFNSAKTPPAIFGPTVLEIENDSKLVFDKIQEFKTQK
jgi:hypothetical protein